MPIAITMPRLSDTMQEGTLNKWHVKVGDKVKSGDILADVETDKATMELQTFDDGIVAALSANEGDTVAVGKLILTLATEGETVEQAVAAGGNQDGAASSSNRATSATDNTDDDDEGDAEETSESSAGGVAVEVAGGKVKVSPLARKLADDKGVDVSQLQGSGPGGRIIKRDVLAAAGEKAPQSSATKSAVKSASPTATSSIAASTNTTKPTVPVKAAASAPEPLRPTAVLESKLIALNTMRKTIAR
ncbi:MAG: pyruvate dehydrogenase complex dihydrolipoamide acetyltransferase, partial [Phycisphaerales bacterium]|nr:pyruvate dehydrogenase complex dihydrolipoamide acetyltransferase [Phycisphaerales bacterium]